MEYGRIHKPFINFNTNGINKGKTYTTQAIGEEGGGINDFTKVFKNIGEVEKKSIDNTNITLSAEENGGDFEFIAKPELEADKANEAIQKTTKEPDSTSAIGKSDDELSPVIKPEADKEVTPIIQNPFGETYTTMALGEEGGMENLYLDK